MWCISTVLVASFALCMAWTRLIVLQDFRIPKDWAYVSEPGFLHVISIASDYGVWDFKSWFSQK